jgi:hypothetical protein
MNHGCSALGRLPAEKDDSNGGLVCVSRRRVRIMVFGFRFTRRTAISDQPCTRRFRPIKKKFLLKANIFSIFLCKSNIFFNGLLSDI